MAAWEGKSCQVHCFLWVADSCQFGSYYNLTLGQCVLCPVGFYAELPGSYLCDACPVEETTAREGTTASVSCSVNPITTTSAAPFTTGARELCVFSRVGLRHKLVQCVCVCVCVEGLCSVHHSRCLSAHVQHLFGLRSDSTLLVEWALKISCLSVCIYLFSGLCMFLVYICVSCMYLHSCASSPAAR